MSCTPSKKLLFCLMCSLIVSAVSLCGVCPPGHFVEKECTGTSNRICKPCPLGTYMDKASLTNKCHKCKKCSGLQEVSSECTATTNTKCKCSKGYYFHTELAICYPCSSCKEGTGVSKECSLTSDTVCEVCKAETYSDLRSMTESCKKCRTCLAGQTVRLNCTKEHDRECDASQKTKLITHNKSKMRPLDGKDQNHRLKPVNTSTKSEEPILQTSTMKPTEKRYTAQDIAEDESSDILKIVIFVLVGLVFLALVLVIGCCFWKQKHPTGQVISEVPVTEKHEKGPKRTVVIDIDGGRPISRVLPEEKYQDQRIENVSYELYEELNTSLNPKNRWKKLAGKLKFKERDVANFELHNGNATVEMLSSWGHGRDATLSALFDVFVNLGWDREKNIVARYMVPASV